MMPLNRVTYFPDPSLPHGNAPIRRVSYSPGNAPIRRVSSIPEVTQ
jgi:hypothetical protein